MLWCDHYFAHAAGLHLLWDSPVSCVILGLHVWPSFFEHEAGLNLLCELPVNSVINVICCRGLGSGLALLIAGESLVTV